MLTRQAVHDQRMPIHLLIVDDSELIRASLHALLKSVAGISSIREAATLGQALDSVRQDPPTLVILDMRLPEGLGMDIIQPLKQLVPTVLIAMFTLHANQVYRKRCLALGADWFFDKLDATEPLLEVVRQHAAENAIKHANQGAHQE